MERRSQLKLNQLGETMTLFKWYKSYSVNNEELDNHHKKLCDILNRLYENCLVNAQPDCLAAVIDELVSYSNYHFTAEEKYMREIGYKGIDKQIIEHADFKQRALQLQRNLNNNDFELTKKLSAFLRNWFLHHIVEEDKKFAI